MTGTSYIVDANVWIDYFVRGRFEDELLHNALETPAIVLVEVAGYLVSHEFSEEDWRKCLKGILQYSAILPLDLERALVASKLRKIHRLKTVDSVIYSYVEPGKRLLTQDADFKGLENVDYRRK